ncbi:unnamed protein product, partial [Didymodactylos carnosus]
YYNKKCNLFDDQCSSFGSLNSICETKYGESPTNNQQPLCLCSSNYLAPTRHLRYDQYLILKYQQIYQSLPHLFRYYHGEILAPPIGILKLYDTNYEINGPFYFILYIQQNITIINIQSARNTSLLCFYGNDYICICHVDHQRVECFGYDRFIDQCSNCSSNDYCLKGDSKIEMILCVYV